MDDTQKMFQIIINGQSSLKQELTGRIDKLGKQLAYLYRHSELAPLRSSQYPWGVSESH